MSSMRNAVSRRNHKERSQPEARGKWGLLEKHKDYSLRAKDFNQKKQKLNILSQKSRERHPDEFAFGMLSADKGVQGRHGRGDQEKNRLSHDAVKLLKTQDSGYLRTIAARGRREIERLGAEVGVDSVMKVRGHENERKILFSHEAEPLVKKRRLSHESSTGMNIAADVEATSIEADDVVAEDMQYSEQEKVAPKIKSRKQLEREREATTRLKAEKRRRKLLRERRAIKLIELQKRQKEIVAAADQLDIQRAKMARMIGGTNRNGIKFKIRERKR